MKQLSIYCGEEKRENKKTAKLIEEKRLFHLYILNTGSYQCMNMCINVPWQFEVILPDGSPR